MNTFNHLPVVGDTRLVGQTIGGMTPKDASTLAVAQRMVCGNERITGLVLRPYVYVPLETSDNNEATHLLTREEFLGLNQAELDVWCDSLGEKYNIALDSKLSLDGGAPGHWQMADLSLPITPDNQDKIINRFKNIIVPDYGGGVLFETGSSYHYLGEGILEEQDWHRFMGNLLLTSIVEHSPDQPNRHELVVDYRHIGHSMVRGSAGLRLTTKDDKTVAPHAVARVF